jgi:hypothetical protein
MRPYTIFQYNTGIVVSNPEGKIKDLMEFCRILKTCLTEFLIYKVTEVLYKHFHLNLLNKEN